ncbi:vWA domain-containing protein [Actinomyces bowdenii]|nr:VWA domain-containing protein [Actinomyces bowdenii]
MTLRPMLPMALVVLMALVMAALLGLARWRMRASEAEPGARAAWWRRAGAAALVIVILAGPSVRASEAVSVSNVEIYMLVDRTGSMAAEDWAGDPPEGVENPTATRLDGVRADMASIRQAFPSARYSIVALDSAAAVELPLTTDVDAVDSWVGSLTQEVTDRSTGSSLETALPQLSQLLARSHEANPQNIRLVYILSDGEATDGGRAAQEAQSQGWDWQAMAPVVDGGAVLGYGTAEGGQMRSYDGSPSTGEHTNADYIPDGPDGQPGLSVIDEPALEALAQDLGVDYLHRTGGPDDDPPESFTDLDIQAVLSDGRVAKGPRHYVVWPLALVVSGLLIWELADLARADRRLRLILRPRRQA